MLGTILEGVLEFKISKRKSKQYFWMEKGKLYRKTTITVVFLIISVSLTGIVVSAFKSTIVLFCAFFFCGLLFFDGLECFLCFFFRMSAFFLHRLMSLNALLLL